MRKSILVGNGNLTVDLLDFLRHKTYEEMPVTSSVLERHFHVTGAEIRQAVHTLRCGGAPIASNAGGYWNAEFDAELEGTIHHLAGRARAIIRCVRALRKTQSTMTHQPSLFDSLPSKGSRGVE